MRVLYIIKKDLTFWSLEGIITMQGRKEEIFEYYRKLKEYTNKFADLRLTELVNTFERKLCNYMPIVATRKERNRRRLVME